MWFKDVELESKDVKLVPLAMDHKDVLINAASDDVFRNH